MSIEEDDIFVQELDQLQQTEVLDQIVHFLKSHGSTPKPSLILEISKLGYHRDLVTTTIDDGCQHGFMIYSKKVTKLLGEELISLK